MHQMAEHLISYGSSGEVGNSGTRIDLRVIAKSLAFPESRVVGISRQLNADDPLAPLVSELVLGGQLKRISVASDQVSVVDAVCQQHVALRYCGERQGRGIVVLAVEDDGDC